MNGPHSLIMRHRDTSGGDVPAEPDVVKVRSEVLTFLGNAVPGDAQGVGQCQDVGESIRKMWAIKEVCWFAEEDEVIYPLHSGFDAMVFKDSQAHISYGSLDSASSSQAFNGDMLHEIVASPLYW